MDVPNIFSVDTSGATHSDDRVSYIVHQIPISDTEERFIVRRGDWSLMMKSDRPIYRKKKQKTRGTYTVMSPTDHPPIDKDMVRKIVAGIDAWLQKNGL